MDYVKIVTVWRTAFEEAAVGDGAAVVMAAPADAGDALAVSSFIGQELSKSGSAKVVEL